jgi:hypothetical protein
MSNWNWPQDSWPSPLSVVVPREYEELSSEDATMLLLEHFGGSIEMLVSRLERKGYKVVKIK